MTKSSEFFFMYSQIHTTAVPIESVKQPAATPESKLYLLIKNYTLFSQTQEWSPLKHLTKPMFALQIIYFPVCCVVHRPLNAHINIIISWDKCYGLDICGPPKFIYKALSLSMMVLRSGPWEVIAFR